MPVPVPNVPYTRDTFSPQQTVWTVNVEGKPYRISASGSDGKKHAAVCLFSDASQGCHWKPKGSSQVFFKQYDDQMTRQTGPWVQIELPAAKSLHKYVFGYRLQKGGGIYSPDATGAPPTAWVVLGSNDGNNWEEVSRASAGKDRWKQAGFDIEGDEWPNSANLEVDTVNRGSFKHFRFLFTKNFKRLDRIQMMVKKGAASGSPIQEIDGEDGEEAPVVEAPSEVDLGGGGIMGFINDNQMLLIGGAVAIIVVIVMMNR